mmetsp:Transcript_45320/g.115085  ORF Transcript_45320/g.115085 Transcript_45320/m.115085 type:complete len:213 (+) Transcript_45320:107-745(+)
MPSARIATTTEDLRNRHHWGGGSTHGFVARLGAEEPGGLQRGGELVPSVGHEPPLVETGRRPAGHGDEGVLVGVGLRVFRQLVQPLRISLRLDAELVRGRQQPPLALQTLLLGGLPLLRLLLGLQLVHLSTHPHHLGIALHAAGALLRLLALPLSRLLLLPLLVLLLLLADLLGLLLHFLNSSLQGLLLLRLLCFSSLPRLVLGAVPCRTFR